MLKRSKLLLAGLAAVLIGFPMAREAFAVSAWDWIGLGIDAGVWGSKSS